MTRKSKFPEITSADYAKHADEMRFLALCGEPNSIDDCWMIQDLPDYIRLMGKLCDRYGIAWEMRYEEHNWTVRAYKRVDDIYQAIILDVEKNSYGALLFCAAIKQLADCIAATWEPIERGNVLNLWEKK